MYQVFRQAWIGMSLDLSSPFFPITQLATINIVQKWLENDLDIFTRAVTKSKVHSVPGEEEWGKWFCGVDLVNDGVV